MKCKSPIVFVSTFSAGLFADLASKAYAKTHFIDGGTSVFRDWISLRYAENAGIAFSAPITGMPLKIVTVTLVALIAYYYAKEEELRWKPLVDAVYAAFLAGAVWNGIERIWMGKVTDFIEVKYFANFNVADIIITLSAAVLVAIHLIYERNRKRG